MRILFIHQNFPGQFKHLAPALAAQGHQVLSLTLKKNLPKQWQGVRIETYSTTRGSTANIHPWLADLETKVIRGEACFRAAQTLKREGYTPDVIVAHPGWGESLFLKQLWPQARLGIYCEFFYQEEGADTGFDPEFPESDDAYACRLRIKNINSVQHFDMADAGISPTEWQASTFPEFFREKISVIHDGIDTDLLRPNSSANLGLNTRGGERVQLSKQQEVITFVNRNLEPYRGYHTFMRALPGLLQRRPQARVIIVGGSERSYGARPDPERHGASTWKEVYLREARPRISDADWERVHFVGKLPYEHFIQLLQLSTVHVYLTYPFVLSWSLLEAMSVGCAIAASDTQPLREAITHGVTGRLFDFFDPEALTEQVASLLEDPAERQRLGQNAREFARAHYDLKTICLPRQLDWIARLAAGHH